MVPDGAHLPPPSGDLRRARFLQAERLRAQFLQAGRLFSLGNFCTNIFGLDVSGEYVYNVMKILHPYRQSKLAFLPRSSLSIESPAGHAHFVVHARSIVRIRISQ